MIKEAIEYSKNGRSRSVIYAANRFVKMVDDRPASQLCGEAVERYITACNEAGLSPATVRSSVKYLLAVAREAGAKMEMPRVSVPRPHPTPTPVDLIDATWPHCPYWVRQWIVLSYWTGMRLTDVLRLQLAIHDGAEFVDSFSWTASKTGRNQSWPIPKWLEAHINRQSLPWGQVTDWTKRLLRAELERATKKSAVARILPKHIRQRSITAWKTADATAGSIIHGSGLGILDHYVDPLTILTAAAPKVKLPDCFGAGQDMPDVVPLFSRLDPAGQQLILSTMERLA